MMSTNIKNYFTSPEKLVPMPKEKLLLRRPNAPTKKHRHSSKKFKRQTTDPDISDISKMLNNSLILLSPNGKDKTDNKLLTKSVNNIACTPATTTPAEAAAATTKTASLTKPNIVHRSNGHSSKENKQHDIKTTPNTSPIITISDKSIPNAADLLSPKKNAFDLMMTARKKSIGTNSPGKQMNCVTNLCTDKYSTDLAKAKRKILLEEWADRKGSAKRKFREIEEEQYVRRQMDKRTKRLKKLLKNGSKDAIVLSDNDKDDEPIVKFKLNTNGANRKLKKKNGQQMTFDSTIKIDLDSPEKSSPKHTAVATTSQQYKPLEIIVSNKKSTLPADSCRKSPESPKSPLVPVHVAASTTAADAFVEVLSSPIKKRDSLLGYFSKISKTPPENDIEIQKQPVTKQQIKQRRPSTKSTKAASRKSTPKKSAKPMTPSKEVAPNSRPKRSCRDKAITYVIDLDHSPAKVAAQKSIKRARRLLSGSSSPSKSPNKTTIPNKKLAPIFMKAPATSEQNIAALEVVRARREFLMSGIPEKMKLEIEKQRMYEELCESAAEIFPAISHVRQWTEPQTRTVPDFSLKFRDSPVDTSNSDQTYKTFSCGHKLKRLADAKIKTYDSTGIAERIVDVKPLVKSLKLLDTTKFQYFRCYKQLSKKSQLQGWSDEDSCNSDNNVQIVDTDSASNDSVQMIDQAQHSAVNGCITFTDKYKPTNCDEILVNSEPVHQLKKFLSAWLENTATKNRDYSTDDEDFCWSMTSDQGTPALDKAIVLLGPPGSGKTSSVYALANELNFKVLELNAGVKRTGKKILQELQEATQSHQVKKGGSSGDAKRSKSSQNSRDNGSSQKLSLILIEDADIVFEQDFGFIEAIYQLVNISKRPVILVANQLHCPHLLRFIAHNAIKFPSANIAHISKWLSTLSIAEKCYVDAELCAKMYTYNGKDLRRTMLELQFFVQSGGDVCAEKHNDLFHHKSIFDFYTQNQNRLTAIPFPIDFSVIRAKASHILNGDCVGSTVSCSLDDGVEFYKCMSDAQRMQSWRTWDDRIVNSLAEDISHDIVDRAVAQQRSKGKTTVNIEAAGKSSAAVSGRILLANNVCRNNESGLTTSRSLNVDVEPCLRTICRSEKLRTQTERRSTRFYHYLRNAVTNSFSTERFNAHCLVFEDNN